MNRWLPHRRRIRRSTLSLPLCIEMCKCGQTLSPMSASTSINSRVTSVASMLESRTRKSPGSSASRAHQMRQPHPILLRRVAIPLDAIVPEMNSREHDFAVAVVHQPPHFVDNVLDRPARQLRPHVRNDAEAAPQHAAVLHLHIRPMPPAKRRRSQSAHRSRRTAPTDRAARACRSRPRSRSAAPPLPPAPASHSNPSRRSSPPGSAAPADESSAGSSSRPRPSPCKC